MNERIIENAKILMAGKVTSPCVKIDGRTGEIASMCPMLNIEEGCESPQGIVVSEARKASCGEGKGHLVISSQKLSELVFGIELSLV